MEEVAAAPQKETEQAIQEARARWPRRFRICATKSGARTISGSSARFAIRSRCSCAPPASFPTSSKSGSTSGSRSTTGTSAISSRSRSAAHAEGRYTIMLMATMVVMRVETTPGFVGIPFDNR